MRNMIKHVRNKDYDGASSEYRALYQAEKDADSIKRKIIDELSKGIFHPLDREDLLRLVLTSDDIASHIKASSKRLEIVIEARHDIPEEFLEFYSQAIDEIAKAVEYIIESVKSLPSSISRALSYTHMVEEIEEKIDDLRYDLMRKLAAKYCDRMNAYYVLLSEAADDLEIASDKCEDTSDIIRTIAVSHS